MNNLEKYKNIFSEALDIGLEAVNEDLVFSKTAEWDSVGHMNLITMIEDGFSILLEQDDMLEFTSFEKGKKILNKYGVLF